MEGRRRRRKGEGDGKDGSDRRTEIRGREDNGFPSLYGEGDGGGGKQAVVGRSQAVSRDGRRAEGEDLDVRKMKG
ncbi:hypothetical protein ACLOJK_009053 [Asimina triloba]